MKIQSKWTKQSGTHNFMDCCFNVRNFTLCNVWVFLYRFWVSKKMVLQREWSNRALGCMLCHIEQYDPCRHPSWSILQRASSMAKIDSDIYSVDQLSKGHRGVCPSDTIHWGSAHKGMGGGIGSVIAMRVSCSCVNTRDILSTTTTKTMQPKSWHFDSLFPCVPMSKTL